MQELQQRNEELLRTLRRLSADQESLQAAKATRELAELAASNERAQRELAELRLSRQRQQELVRRKTVLVLGKDWPVGMISPLCGVACDACDWALTGGGSCPAA